MESCEAVKKEKTDAPSGDLLPPLPLPQKLELWVPGQLIKHLHRLLYTGLYGRTVEEAAERLLASAVEERM